LNIHAPFLATVAGVLRGGVLAEGDGFRLADVRCGGAPGGFGRPEESGRHGLVFVYRGAFVRRYDGAEVLLDSTAAYLTAPGDEQRFAHPVGGDACLAVHFSPELLASLAGGSPAVSVRAIEMDAVSLLAIRRLMALARAGDPDGELAEAVVRTVSGVLARRIPDRVAGGRPRPAAHYGLARRVRELLLEDPGLGVIELSRRVHCSPHHLSRVFGWVTGSSVSEYRTRIRVGRALDRIAEGETNLAALACDLGFADHAHLTRTIRAVTGRTPSALRAALRRGTHADTL
jgi:AraC-like DNA-binding protein